MIEPQEILARIAELHQALLKLFTWSLYELPRDVVAYYISDRPHPEAKRHGYHFQLFLLRSTSFTWISLEFHDGILDRRHIQTFPLHRMESVKTFQFGTDQGLRMGCAIEVGGLVFTLPLKGDPHSLEDPAAHRAFAFGKSISDHL